MKKVMLLPLLFLPAVMVSCSDDKEDEIKDAAKEIVGNYEGYTVANSAYFSDMVAPDQTVRITSVAPNVATVEFTSDTWGSFSIPAATVSSDGRAYVLSGRGTSKMGMGGNLKDYECTFSGEVAGGVAGFTFELPAVMGGLSMTFAQGEIPESIVVPGTYKGYTKADCAYFGDMYADDQTITIELNDGVYSLSYTSDTWGSFAVSNVKVERDGNTFKLSGEGVTTMGMGDNVQDYPCSLTGEIDAAKETPAFLFSVPSVMGGLTVDFRTGDMPGQEE